MEPLTILALAGLLGMLYVGQAVMNLMSKMGDKSIEEQLEESPPRESSFTQHVNIGFDPIELDDALYWPSERPWSTKTNLKPLEWPSTHWNDTHFGKFSKMAHDAHDHLSHPSHSIQPAPPVEVKKPSPKKRKQAKKQPRQRAPKATPVVQTPPRRATPAPQPREVPANRSNEPFTRAELEQMVGTIGLAGTVKQIMSVTGMDFKNAAQFLAKSRQS